MEIPKPNTRSNVKVSKPQIFNREMSKVLGFLTACRLYIRMRMRKAVVEKQIQWVLSYVQGESVDIWKKNILENLETRALKYVTIGNF